MKNPIIVRNSISFLILTVSALLWMLLLFNPGNLMTVEHCHISLSGASEQSFQMLLKMNPPMVMMMGWTLMVFAMMLPKLIMPIQYIYERSFKHQRLLSSLLFVLGYAMIWILVGVVMNIIILGSNLLMPNSFVPAIIVAVIAFIWQFSPIKQRFLNRGHDHVPLAAFGWAAHKDALKFGFIHGIWCVCAGWALMLFPMLLPKGHTIAMCIVTILMISEHMEHPQVPRWKLDLRLKLIRIFFIQVKMKLNKISNT